MTFGILHALTLCSILTVTCCYVPWLQSANQHDEVVQGPVFTREGLREEQQANQHGDETYASPYMHLVSSLSLSGHGSKPYQRDTPTEQDPHLWERRKRGRRTFTVDNCKNLTGTNYFCYTSKSLLPKNIFMPGSPVWAYQTSRFFHSDGQLHTLHLDVDIPCNYFRGPCVLKIESRMYIITAHV